MLGSVSVRVLDGLNGSLLLLRSDHLCFLFLRFLWELLERMESATMFANGKLSLTSWAGLQVEVTPIALCAIHTQCNTSNNTTVRGKKINSTPISLCPCLPSLVWCDKATERRWPLHLRATRWRVGGRVFVLSVRCCCCLCQWFMAEDHMKWLTAQAWPNFQFFFFLGRCHCEVYVRRQAAWLILFRFHVLPWSESVLPGRVEWDCNHLEKSGP